MDKENKIKAIKKAEHVGQIVPNDLPNIVNVYNSLLEEAINKNSSDIHIDPLSDKVIARLRIDGLMIEHASWPKAVHSALISRIKILSGLRTDMHQTPQDGRIRAVVNNKAYDIRVSIIPTLHGENSVMRILPTQRQNSSYGQLGLSEIQERVVRQALRQTSGLIIVCGPTGSGKTTTLYSLLDALKAKPLNIVTLEDPVEYSIPGIRQIPILPRSGLTFAQGLRSVLRQDPDVIMVGEIRDEETATLAIHAALTGHLVLSTLHTTDAAKAIPRLIDMGIPNYLISATLKAVISQRLPRKYCDSCAGKGCPDCSKTGYRGRTGIYEILPIDQNLSDCIRDDPKQFEYKIQKNGYMRMRDHGHTKVDDHITSINEIDRVLSI